MAEVSHFQLDQAVQQICSANSEARALEVEINGKLWQKYAACIGTEPEVFLDPDYSDLAKGICANCVVVQPCLEFALQFNTKASSPDDRDSVWGGATFRERKEILLQRKRQAAEEITGSKDDFAELTEMFEALPKIPETDPRVVTYLNGGGFPHKQFGNNFYLLFLAIANGRRDEEDLLWRVYADRFFSTPGVERILSTDEYNDTVEFFKQKPWKELNKFTTAYSSKRNELITADREATSMALKSLIEACGGTLGLKMVSTYVFDPMNKLLEATAEIMSTSGINPSSFYG
jgi:hypothetical protein